MQSVSPAPDVNPDAAPVPGVHRARILGRYSPAQWYAALVAAFLAVRAITTLAAGAAFGAPGDGWRAVFQLCVACVLLASVRARAGAARAVLGVGVLYLIVTVLGLLNGHDILGVIPVDGRDKVVHPLLGLTALLVGLWERRALAAAAS
jgi:hypothetical protein